MKPNLLITFGMEDLNVRMDIIKMQTNNKMKSFLT